MADSKEKKKQVLVSEHHHSTLRKIAKHDRRGLSHTNEVIIEEAAAKRKIPVDKEADSKQGD